jgi:hypothetical protein
VSTVYDHAIELAQAIARLPQEDQDTRLVHVNKAALISREFLAQHERMQAILWSIKVVLADITSDEGERAYAEAWAALKRAVGIEVEP